MTAEQLAKILESIQWFVAELGLPLALFGFTIFVVLMLLNRESQIRGKSIETVNNITIENQASLKTLQKDYRDLMRRYVNARDAYHKVLNAFNLLKEQYRNDKEEWRLQYEIMMDTIRTLKTEVEELRSSIVQKDQEIVRLRKHA